MINPLVMQFLGLKDISQTKGMFDESLPDDTLDNQPRRHWLFDEDLDLNMEDEVNELLQTGSVTTTIGGKKYIVALIITPEK